MTASLSPDLLAACLAEIRARRAGVTMSDPLTYCKSADDVTPLLAAVEAALGEHRSYRIYEPCDHDHTEEDVAAGRAVETGDFISCEELYLYTVCRGCCTFAGSVYGGQLEECAADHDHSLCYPCRTREAITTALLGGSGD